MGQKCIQVPVVLGQNATQHLICTEIPLRPRAFEIKDTKHKVEVTSCKVGGLVRDIDGGVLAKVIVDAVLRKNINFKTVADDCRPRQADEAEAGQVIETRVVCGDVRHCHVEVEFCTLIEVKLKGVSFTDEDEIDGISKQQFLEELRCTVKKAEVVAEAVEEERDKDGCITRVVEKDVVRIEVKVERLEELLVSADTCPPFPC